MKKIKNIALKTINLIDVGSSKVSDCAYLAKIKLSKSSFNQAISKHYELLGKAYYDEQKGNCSCNERKDDIIEEIYALEEDLFLINAEIALANGRILCEECYTENNVESTFCSVCGTNLNEYDNCCCGDDTCCTED